MAESCINLDQVDLVNIENGKLIEILKINGFKNPIITESTKSVYIACLKKRLGSISIKTNADKEKISNTLPMPFSNSEIISKSVNSDDSVYYGIIYDGQHNHDSQNQSLSPSIVTSMKDVMEISKSCRNLRFKPCKSIGEANSFVQTGSPKKISNDSCEKILKEASQPISMKELISFRNKIKENDSEFVRNAIKTNNNYLIDSNNDGPLIYHEGSRRNMFHLCAEYNSYNVLLVAINFILDITWLSTIYVSNENSTSSEDFLIEKSHRLLDLYLNTPDKIVNDTPLHLACRFSSYNVAKILLSLKLTNRDVINKFNDSPSSVIGTKKLCPELNKSIEELFQNCWYIVLLRDSKDYHKYDIHGPVQFPMNSCNILETCVVTGPTTFQMANKLRNEWKGARKWCKNLLMKNYEKGIEVIGRKIARKYGIDFKEKWSFLPDLCDLFRDISSLEQYFERKVGTSVSELSDLPSSSSFAELSIDSINISFNRSFNKSSNRSTNLDSSFSTICNSPTPIKFQLNNWSYMNESVDMDLSNLCDYMNNLNIDNNAIYIYNKIHKIDFHVYECIENSPSLDESKHKLVVEWIKNIKNLKTNHPNI